MRLILSLALALSALACGTKSVSSVSDHSFSGPVFVTEIWDCKAGDTSAVVDFKSDSTVHIYMTLDGTLHELDAIGTPTMDRFDFSMSRDGSDQFSFRVHPDEDHIEFSVTDSGETSSGFCLVVLP